MFFVFVLMALALSFSNLIQSLLAGWCLFRMPAISVPLAISAPRHFGTSGHFGHLAPSATLTLLVLSAITATPLTPDARRQRLRVRPLAAFVNATTLRMHSSQLRYTSTSQISPPPPKYLKQTQSPVPFATFYHHFIPASPFHSLTLPIHLPISRFSSKPTLQLAVPTICMYPKGEKGSLSPKIAFVRARIRVISFPIS